MLTELRKLRMQPAPTWWGKLLHGQTVIREATTASGEVAQKIPSEVHLAKGAKGVQNSQTINIAQLLCFTLPNKAKQSCQTPPKQVDAASVRRRR